LIATALPDTGAFSWLVVLTLVTLSTLAVNLMNLWRSGQAQKREVSFTEQHPTRAEQAQIEARVLETERTIDAIRNEMKSDRIALMEVGEGRAKELHNRINPITENTAMIKGQMEAFTTSFQNFTKILCENMTRNSQDKK